MVEHIKTAEQIVAEAIAIHVDTEGIEEHGYAAVYDVTDLETILYWALDQAGVI